MSDSGVIFTVIAFPSITCAIPGLSSAEYNKKKIINSYAQSSDQDAVLIPRNVVSLTSRLDTALLTTRIWGRSK